MTNIAPTKPSPSSVATPVSNDRLDSRLTGGTAPRGPGPRPSVRQRVRGAGSTPAQPAGMPAPRSVGPVTQRRVGPLEDPSVFDVLNIFRARWFLNREHLLSLILSAVKGGDDNEVMWIDLLPQAHSHLLRQAKNLAPPSYPSALLKRVMFVYLLEVVNASRPSTVDKFVKTSAPRRRRALPLVPPSPPPVPDSAPAEVGASAPTRGSEVLPVRTPPGDTDTQSTPMAIDDAPPDPLYQALLKALNQDLTAASAAYDLSRRHGLLPIQIIPVYNRIQAGLSEADALNQVLDSTPASSKRPRPSPSPPSSSCPSPPQPRVGSRYGTAPEDWRSWIATHRRSRGGQGPLAFNALIVPDDVA